MHSFSISEAIRFGFRMFLRNFWLLIGLSLAGFLVQWGTDIISKKITERSGLAVCNIQADGQSVTLTDSSGDFVTITSNKISDIIKSIAGCFKADNLPYMFLIFLLNLFAAIFLYILLMGWNRIALDLYDNGSSSFDRIFVVLPLLFNYLIAGLLYSVVVCFGLILFIIPGVIWAIKYGFFDLEIIDSGCGPIEALSKSGRLTYGNKGKIFLFAMVALVITILSIITIVGPFILSYVFFLSRAYIFRKLQGK